MNAENLLQAQSFRLLQAFPTFRPGCFLDAGIVCDSTLANRTMCIIPRPTPFVNPFSQDILTFFRTQNLQHFSQLPYHYPLLRSGNCRAKRRTQHYNSRTAELFSVFLSIALVHGFVVFIAALQGDAHSFQSEADVLLQFQLLPESAVGGGIVKQVRDVEEDVLLFVGHLVQQIGPPAPAVVFRPLKIYSSTRAGNFVILNPRML